MNEVHCEVEGKPGILKLYYFGDHLVLVNRALYDQVQAQKFVVVNTRQDRIEGVHATRSAALSAVPAYNPEREKKPAA